MVTPRQSQIKALAARTTQLERTIALRARTAQADLDSAVFPTGRLTPESGVPVSHAPTGPLSTFYYTPYIGATVPIFDGARWTALEFDEMTFSLTSNAAYTGYHQADKNFDLFIYKDEATGALKIGTGPAWNTNTTRGLIAGTTAIERLNGIYVNVHDIEIRYGTGAGDYTTVGANEATYIGTLRTEADGQSNDTVSQRFLWNAYHRAERHLYIQETTDSWNYSTAAWRIANNSGSNIVEYVCGFDYEAVEAFAYHMVINSTTTARRCSVGIGLDSTTVNSALFMNNSAVIDVRTNLSAHFFGWSPGTGSKLGYHYLSWLEYGAGANTQTWYGDNGDADTMQSGLIAKVWC